ncbi:hypothetical protein [Chromobacterium violaceum]|uniref:hypothetical protein n=1 Tax=Chromobacterium violaceum TaxID=536 RepID=UPI001B3452EF|nr:hypothetical protein [Chromobacterium violaceum]MBP4047297.1 hypothetical protein [Chromobacterium violaceum]
MNLIVNTVLLAGLGGLQECSSNIPAPFCDERGGRQVERFNEMQKKAKISTNNNRLFRLILQVIGRGA